MEFWEAVLAPRLPAAVRDAIVTIDHAAASIGLPRGVGMYATLMLVTLVMMRIVAWVLVGRRRGAVQKGDRVLLVGPCGSGKTIMIYKLLWNEQPETVSSMTANDMMRDMDYGAPRPKTVRVVDIPGHRSHLPTIVRQLGRAAGVVLVVDAVHFDVRVVAELLHDLLVSPEINAGNVPLLVACNKSDAPLARSPTRIRDMLEKELDRIKDTRASLAQEGEEAGNTIMLGVEGQKFTFEQDCPCEIDFCACAAKEGQLDDVRSFVARCL